MKLIEYLKEELKDGNDIVNVVADFSEPGSEIFEGKYKDLKLVDISPYLNHNIVFAEKSSYRDDEGNHALNTFLIMILSDDFLPYAMLGEDIKITYGMDNVVPFNNKLN